MSRNIDKQVAEALGAVIQDRPERKSLIFPHPNYRMLAVCFPVKYDPSKITSDWTQVDDQWWATGNLPFYSTDIAAAIGALEKFCEIRGWCWQTRRGQRRSGVVYMCQIFTDRIEIAHEDNTITAAICAAILAAKNGRGNV